MTLEIRVRLIKPRSMPKRHMQLLEHSRTTIIWALRARNMMMEETCPTRRCNLIAFQNAHSFQDGQLRVPKSIKRASCSLRKNPQELLVQDLRPVVLDAVFGSGIPGRNPHEHGLRVCRLE